MVAGIWRLRSVAHLRLCANRSDPKHLTDRNRGSHQISSARKELTDLSRLPKTELHLHLEGAIPHETLLQIVHKYGGKNETSDLAALEKRFRYRNFSDFIETWIWMTGYLREYEDFRLAASSMVRWLGTSGVRYAEVSFSPGRVARFGLALQPLALAIREGIDDALADDADSQVRVNLIVDLVRDLGPELGSRWLEEAADVMTAAGIVAVGIGGSEERFPPEAYENVFRRAESLRFHRVAHAGEAAGPQSVWGAVKVLGVERVGHGIRSIEDLELVDHLRRHRIPLEVCLSSNHCTGFVNDLGRHPLPALLRAGVPITLSSDDPAMFATDLPGEYRIARDRLGLSDEELVRIARAGFEVAFLPDADRASLLAEFDDALAKQSAGSIFCR